MSATEQSHVRHIPFEGTPNFRDYGGYQTETGGRVKWRSLFRSGQLAALTEADLEHLGTLGIQLVFDFRREDEQLRDPSLFPPHATPTIVGLPISPGSSINFLEVMTNNKLKADDIAELMCQINREFVHGQSGYYRLMFEHLLDQAEGASLIHCSAGKDRTGFAAAMILSALGVPREKVMQDYMLTSSYFDIDREMERVRRKYQWQGDNAVMRPVLEVREQYLRTAFEAIEEKFSDLEAYLTEELGVDSSAREVLRHRYLEA